MYNLPSNATFLIPKYTSQRPLYITYSPDLKKKERKKLRSAGIYGSIHSRSDRSKQPHSLWSGITCYPFIHRHRFLRRSYPITCLQRSGFLLVRTPRGFDFRSQHLLSFEMPADSCFLLGSCSFSLFGYFVLFIWFIFFYLFDFLFIYWYHVCLYIFHCSFRFLFLSLIKFHPLVCFISFSYHFFYSFTGRYFFFY